MGFASWSMLMSVRANGCGKNCGMRGKGRRSVGGKCANVVSNPTYVIPVLPCRRLAWWGLRAWRRPCAGAHPASQQHALHTSVDHKAAHLCGGPGHGEDHVQGHTQLLSHVHVSKGRRVGNNDVWVKGLASFGVRGGDGGPGAVDDRVNLRRRCSWKGRAWERVTWPGGKHREREEGAVGRNRRSNCTACIAMHHRPTLNPHTA